MEKYIKKVKQRIEHDKKVKLINGYKPHEERSMGNDILSYFEAINDEYYDRCLWDYCNREEKLFIKVQVGDNIPQTVGEFKVLKVWNTNGETFMVLENKYIFWQCWLGGFLQYNEVTNRITVATIAELKN